MSPGGCACPPAGPPTPTVPGRSPRPAAQRTGPRPACRSGAPERARRARRSRSPPPARPRRLPPRPGPPRSRLAPTAAPPGGMRGHAWGALRREWIKLLFQRRSYLIWGGAFAIPFLIALAFYLTRHNPESGGGGPPFVERITSNGMFVTLAAAVLPHQLPAAAGRRHGRRLHDRRRGGAGHAAHRPAPARPARLVRPRQVDDGHGVPWRRLPADVRRPACCSAASSSACTRW